MFPAAPQIRGVCFRLSRGKAGRKRHGFFSKRGRSLIISEGWTQEASEHIVLGPKLKTSLIFQRNIAPMKSPVGLKWTPECGGDNWEGRGAGGCKIAHGHHQWRKTGSSLPTPRRNTLCCFAVVSSSGLAYFDSLIS